MFNVGDILRVKDTEEIVRVLEVGENDVCCATGNDDDYKWYYNYEVEFVSSELDPKKVSIPRPNVHKMSDEQLTDEFNKFIVSIVKRVRDADIDDRVYINMRAECYGSREVDIAYRVGISAGDEVTSNNLRTSVEIAINRYLENKRLEVKAIPLYVANDNEKV